MIYVKNAKYIKDYKLNVEFSDGKEGLVDLEKTILSDNRQIFQELSNKEKFSQIKIDMDTIVWSNGLDLAPEFLYELLQNK